MYQEACRDFRGRMLPGSYPYAGNGTAAFERVKFYGIFDKHANLKYKYGNRHFWCRGYYVDTVGRYEGAIKEYIRNQLEEDIAQDSLNFKEYTDPFTGEPVK